MVSSLARVAVAAAVLLLQQLPNKPHAAAAAALAVTRGVDGTRSYGTSGARAGVDGATVQVALSKAILSGAPVFAFPAGDVAFAKKEWLLAKGATHMRLLGYVILLLSVTRLLRSTVLPQH